MCVHTNEGETLLFEPLVVCSLDITEKAVITSVAGSRIILFCILKPAGDTCRLRVDESIQLGK